MIKVPATAKKRAARKSASCKGVVIRWAEFDNAFEPLQFQWQLLPVVGHRY